MSTTIEWTDETWNPIVGCSRVSPGCDHCYAVGVVHRQMSPQHVGLTIKRPGEPTDWNGQITVAESRMDQPLRWRKPRRIFVNSLSDLFHPEVTNETIARIFAVMALAPQHTFQVLTKRARRMAFLLSTDTFWAEVLDETDRLRPEQDLDMGFRYLSNVWLGTSVESDRYTFRAEHLRRTPAAVRFISAEPLLGPLPSLDLTGIDWLIVGGESGPGARPMHPDWVRDLRDQCHAPLSEPGEFWPLGRTAFFFKQWGDWGPMCPTVDGVMDMSQGHTVAEDGTLYGPDDLAWPDGPRRGEAIRAGHDHHHLAGMYRLGKKANGRDLDGRTWDEMPK